MLPGAPRDDRRPGSSVAMGTRLLTSTSTRWIQVPKPPTTSLWLIQFPLRMFPRVTAERQAGREARNRAGTQARSPRGKGTSQRWALETERTACDGHGEGTAEHSPWTKGDPSHAGNGRGADSATSPSSPAFPVSSLSLLRVLRSPHSHQGARLSYKR